MNSKESRSSTKDSQSIIQGGTLNLKSLNAFRKARLDDWHRTAKHLCRCILFLYRHAETLKHSVYSSHRENIRRGDTSLSCATQVFLSTPSLSLPGVAWQVWWLCWQWGLTSPSPFLSALATASRHLSQLVSLLSRLHLFKCHPLDSPPPRLWPVSAAIHIQLVYFFYSQLFIYLFIYLNIGFSIVVNFNDPKSLGFINSNNAALKYKSVPNSQQSQTHAAPIIQKEYVFQP